MILHGMMLGWGHENMATAEAWCLQLQTTTWIKQLNPSDMKWAALVAARNWRAKPDLTLAAWLDQFPLSATDKADTLKGPYPDSYHISKYPPTPAPNKP